jgi:hypothetical protein
LELLLKGLKGYDALNENTARIEAGPDAPAVATGLAMPSIR